MPDRPLVEADFTPPPRAEPAGSRALRCDPQDAEGRQSRRGAHRGDGGDRGGLSAARRPVAEGLRALRGSVLEEMMRMFDSEGLRSASGDVFGRIYEYFLAEFSKQGAHDGGEFFTPPSIVQTIVNVIEPDHGIILDPACGSGGMFVQSSHFIEDAGQDTMKRVTFYGHEKNETTAKLAQDQPRGSRAARHDPGRKRSHHLLQGPARTRRQVRLRDGQSALQRGRGGCREGEGRQAPAVRPAGREQGEEGLERQLSLDVLFLQLPERKRPRGRRHVVAGIERRAATKRPCGRSSSRPARSM